MKCDSISVSFRSYFVAQKWIKNPQKIQVPEPPVPAKNRKRCNSAPHDPRCYMANQNESFGEDYMSVYKSKQLERPVVTHIVEKY